MGVEYTSKEERTRFEMEIGRRRQILYHIMEELEKKQFALKERFPTLRLDFIVKSPYTHITITVQSKATGQSFEIVDPVAGLPSDHCIAQLMLLS